MATGPTCIPLADSLHGLHRRIAVRPPPRRGASRCLSELTQAPRRQLPWGKRAPPVSVASPSQSRDAAICSATRCRSVLGCAKWRSIIVSRARGPCPARWASSRPTLTCWPFRPAARPDTLTEGSHPGRRRRPLGYHQTVGSIDQSTRLWPSASSHSGRARRPESGR